MCPHRFYELLPERKLTELASRDVAVARHQSGGTVWLDFEKPTRDDLSPLMEPLGLHPLQIEDCLDEDQIPKIEDFATNTFILFNAFEYRDKELSIHEVDFMLGARFLISVHGMNGGSCAFAERVQRDFATLAFGFKSMGLDVILQLLMDQLVDQKFEAIEAIQDQLDESEEQVLEPAREFDPRDLLQLRRMLLRLRKSLFHEREILSKVCRKDSPHISEGTIYSFRDIYDHLAKFFEAIEICREMITSLMEMHLSIVNNRMSLLANRTNRTVSRLTLITTIFMPLTLVASMGGMSEWSMMTGPENWPIAYSLFLLGMVGLGALSYWLLRRFERISDEH